MKKSEINPLPVFFDRYINLVEEDDLFDGFQTSLRTLESVDPETYKRIGDKKYQADKWSVKDIFQHIIDNERIQSYRALRFARLDKTILPGYDENIFGQNSKAANRTLDDLIAELITVRISTIHLFKSLDQSVYSNSGICFNQSISVLAIGFVIIGHQIHHLKVIKEKYISLIGRE